MSWYPPGVTGDEFEIAGWDSETAGDDYCENCEDTTPGVKFIYKGRGHWVCDECEWQSDEHNYKAEWDADRGDELYDAKIDAMYERKDW